MGRSILQASIDNGHPLVLYSWFVLTIIVFFAVFYVSALIAKKDIPLLIALVGFALFCFVFAMQKLGFEEFWYNAAWAFPLGLCCKFIHPRIAGAFKTHQWMYLSITGFIAFWWILIAEYFFWFGYLARLCSTLSVCIFTFLLMFKLRIKNLVLVFLGKISLYIYMSHGLFVTVMTRFITPAEQPYLFVSIIITGSVLLAWLFHFVYDKLQKRLLMNTRRSDKVY